MAEQEQNGNAIPEQQTQDNLGSEQTQFVGGFTIDPEAVQSLLEELERQRQQQSSRPKARLAQKVVNSGIEFAQTVYDLTGHVPSPDEIVFAAHLITELKLIKTLLKGLTQGDLEVIAKHKVLGENPNDFLLRGNRPGDSDSYSDYDTIKSVLRTQNPRS